MFRGSSSSSSTHHKVLTTVKSLLDDRNCQIPDKNLKELRNVIDEFQKELYLASHEDSNKSEITPADSQYYDWAAKELSNVLDLLHRCQISHSVSELAPALPQPGDDLLPYLLCFSLLDEAAVMKKRDIIYWWVGQGLIDFCKPQGEDAQHEADLKLRQLVDSGAIEQVVCSIRKKGTSGYRLIMKIPDLQSRIEDYKQKVHILTSEKKKMKLPPSKKIITNENENSYECKEILFNPHVSTLKIERDWLCKMSKLRVLHLGMWSTDKSSNKDREHRVVEEVGFLAAFEQLTKVAFVSLKGLSGIMELGEEICNLRENLRVLDLQACPNLESLPKKIGKFKNLTHMDLSECYLLDRVPKGITSLTKLQVLEGFVIGDVDSNSSCKFKDLANHLGTKLRKLSIRTRKLSFPNVDDLESLSKFENLLKLKVVWVRISSDEANRSMKEADESDEANQSQKKQEAASMAKKDLPVARFKRSLAMRPSRKPGLPEKLQKLDVHDIPQKAVEDLLLSNNDGLRELNKLYIIGGQLSDLTKQGAIKWESLTTFRLKYLAKLHMTWREFRTSFPNVTHFEMTRCPHLLFFPCDKDGIWKATVDV